MKGITPGLSRCLITGASAGIGAATARLFAERGCDLFLVARRQERLDEVAGQCRERGARRVAIQALDLSHSGAGAGVVQQALAELGGLDIFVGNAGYGIYGPVHEVEPDAMERLWQVNYQSIYESLHCLLPHLIEQRRGHIVLVSSILGKKAFPLAGTYCATKFALVGLGEALWGELKEHGIGVSVICPGYTDTEFQSAAHYTASVSRMRRIGGQSADQVARALLKAIRKQRREIHLTGPGKMVCALDRMAPNFTTWLVARGVTWLRNRGSRKE